MTARGGRRFGRSTRVAATADLTDHVHPYLVPAEYPDVLSTPTQAQRSIGHGLSLALVSPSGPAEAEVLAAVTADALESAGLAIAAAYAQAERNLLRALSDRRIEIRTFEQGPSGHPLVVASGHWLAATAVSAPGLFERLAAFLGDDVTVAVPDRNLLLAFPAAARSAMEIVVDEEHRKAAKPLTNGLFSLTAVGPAPIG